MDLNSSTGKNGSHNVSTTDQNHSPFRPSTAAEEIDYLNEVLKQIESKSNLTEEFQSRDVFEITEIEGTSFNDHSSNIPSNSISPDAKVSDLDDVNPNFCPSSYIDNFSVDTQSVNLEHSVVEDLSSSFISEVGDLERSVILDKVSDLLSEGATPVDYSSSSLSVDLALVKTEPLDDLGSDFNLEDFLDPAEDFKVKEETVVKLEDINDEYSPDLQAIKVEPGMFTEMTSSDTSEVRFRVDENVKLYSREQLHAAKLISQSTLAAVVDMDMFDNVGKSMPIIHLSALDQLANNISLVPAADFDIVYKFFAKYGKSFLDWKNKFRYSTSRKHTGKRLHHDKYHRKHLESDKLQRKHEKHNHSKSKGTKSTKSSLLSPNKSVISHKSSSSHDSYQEKSDSSKHYGTKKSGKHFSSYSPDGELNFVPHKKKYSKTLDSKKKISRADSSERREKSDGSKYKSKRIVCNSGSDSDEANSVCEQSMSKVSKKLSVSPVFEGFNGNVPDNYKLLIQKCEKVQVRLDMLSPNQWVNETPSDTSANSGIDNEEDETEMTIGMALRKEDSPSNRVSEYNKFEDLPKNIQEEKSDVNASQFKVLPDPSKTAQTKESSDSENVVKVNEASVILSLSASSSSRASDTGNAKLLESIVHKSTIDMEDIAQCDTFTSKAQSCHASIVLAVNKTPHTKNSAPVSDAAAKGIDESHAVHNLMDVCEDAQEFPKENKCVLHDSLSQQPDSCSSSDEKQAVKTDLVDSPVGLAFSVELNQSSIPIVSDDEHKEEQSNLSISHTASSAEPLLTNNELSSFAKDSIKTDEFHDSLKKRNSFETLTDLVDSSLVAASIGNFSEISNKLGNRENIQKTDSELEERLSTQNNTGLRTDSKKSVNELIKKYKIKKCFVKLRDVAKKKKYKKIVLKGLKYLTFDKEKCNAQRKSQTNSEVKELEKKNDVLFKGTMVEKSITKTEKRDSAAKEEILMKLENKPSVPQPDAAVKIGTGFGSSSKEGFKFDSNKKLDSKDKTLQLAGTKVDKNRKYQHEDVSSPKMKSDRSDTRKDQQKDVSSPKLKSSRFEKNRHEPGLPKVIQEVQPLKKPSEISSPSSMPKLSGFKIPKKKLEPENATSSHTSQVLLPPSPSMLKKPDNPPKTYKEWRLYRQQQQQQQQKPQFKLQLLKPVPKVAPKPVIEGWASKKRNEVVVTRRESIPHARDTNQLIVTSFSQSSLPTSVASRDDLASKVDCQNFQTGARSIVSPMTAAIKADSSFKDHTDSTASSNVDVSPFTMTEGCPSFEKHNSALNQTCPQMKAPTDFLEFDWAKKIAAFNLLPPEKSRNTITKTLQDPAASQNPTPGENIINVNTPDMDSAWEGSEMDHTDSHSPASETGGAFAQSHLDKTLNLLSSIIEKPISAENNKKEQRPLLPETTRLEAAEPNVESIKNNTIDKMKIMDRREKHKYFEGLKRKYYDTKNLYLNEPGSRKTNARKVRIHELFIEIREEFYTVKEFLYQERKEKLVMEKNIVEEEPYCPEDVPYSPSEEPPIPEAETLNDSSYKNVKSTAVDKDEIQTDPGVDESREKHSSFSEIETSYTENRTKFSSVVDTIMNSVVIDGEPENNLCDTRGFSSSPGQNSHLVMPLVFPQSKATNITEGDVDSYTLRNPSPVYSEMSNSDSRSQSSSHITSMIGANKLLEDENHSDFPNISSLNTDPIPIVTDATFQNIPDHNLSLSDFLTQSLSNLQASKSKALANTHSVSPDGKSSSDHEQVPLPVPCPPPNASIFPTSVSSLVNLLPSSISLETLAKNIINPATLLKSTALHIPAISLESGFSYNSRSFDYSEASSNFSSVQSPNLPLLTPKSYANLSSSNHQSLLPQSKQTSSPCLDDIKPSSSITNNLIKLREPSPVPAPVQSSFQSLSSKIPSSKEKLLIATKELSCLPKKKQILQLKPVEVPCSLPLSSELPPLLIPAELSKLPPLPSGKLPSLSEPPSPILPSKQPPPLPSEQRPPLPSKQLPPLPSEQPPPPLPSEQPPPLPSEQPPPLPSEQPPPLPSEQPPPLPSEQPPPLPSEQPPPLPSEQPPPLPSEQPPPLPSEQPPPLPSEQPPPPPCGPPLPLQGSDPTLPFLTFQQHPLPPPLPPPAELIPPPPLPDYDPLPPPPVPMFSYPTFTRHQPSREPDSVLNTRVINREQSTFPAKISSAEEMVRICTTQVSMDIDSDTSETEDVKVEYIASIKKLREWNNIESSQLNEDGYTGIDANFLASFGVILESSDTSESQKDKENCQSPVNQMKMKRNSESLSLLNEENLRMMHENLNSAPKISHTRGQLLNKKLFSEDDLINSVELKSDLEIIFSHVSIAKDISLVKSNKHEDQRRFEAYGENPFTELINALDDVSKYYKATPLAQALLEKHDIPFVGLQYVVEVQQSGKPDLDSSYYVCALCSKKMSSKTLVAHIRSVPHRLKFTEHHCPKLHSTYGAIQIKQWTAVLVKNFSAEMEKVSASMGTFQMAVCEEREMNPLLATIKENIGNLEKFRSYLTVGGSRSSTPSAAGQTSTKSAAPKTGQAAAASRSAGLPDFLREKLKQGLKRDSPHTESRSVTAGARGRSPALVDLDSPSPKRSKRSDIRGSHSPHGRRSCSPVRTDLMMGDPAGRVAGFKKDFDNFYSRHAEKEMYYKKNPESHPEYSSEWKMFWERRYHELASKGINPNKHDFKAEWAVFWNDRMKDIFSSVVENKKEALMKKHKITKEDLEEKRPVSPWEDADDMHVQKHLEPEYSVVGTLNALIEVESLLGAFGPAIKTLLLKALNLSTEGKKTIEIFFDADNLTLMKLSQDKLITQSRQNEGAMAHSKRVKAIECCKWLITEVERQRSSKEDYLGLDIKEIAGKTMGMDTVQIAQQIALSLLKVGKSNVSEDDLQKILLAVSASHAKLLMERQQMRDSRAIGDVQVSSTTPTIEESREGPNTGRPLFPSAASSHPSRSHTQQQHQSVGSTVPSSASDNEVKQTAPPPAVYAPSKDKGSGLASGALGQLMSAYDDDPPRDMEKLSLEDLVNLLSNFKDLSRDEQVALTSYLKRLEATDSKKVTKLREMVQKNAKVNEEARRKMEIQYRNQKAASVASSGNQEKESSRPPSSQSNHHQPEDDRPLSRHSSHSQPSGQRISSPTRQLESENRRQLVAEGPPDSQFAYAGGPRSQQSEFRRFPVETDRPLVYPDSRPLPRDGPHDYRVSPNMYRDDPRLGNGSPIRRDGHSMNREDPHAPLYRDDLDLRRDGPNIYRDDSLLRSDPHMLREGRPMSRDGPPMSREGPPLSREGPPLSREGPPLSREGPPLSREGPPMSREGPSMSREGLPMSREGLPMSREGPPMSREGPPMSRDGPPMSRDGPPMYRDDPRMPRDGPPMYRDEPQMRHGQSPIPRDDFRMGRDMSPLSRSCPPMYRDDSALHRAMSPGPPPFRDGRLPLPRDGPATFRDELPLRREAPLTLREEMARFLPVGEQPYLPRDGPLVRRPVSPLRREGSFGYPGQDDRNPPRRDEVSMYRDGFDRPLPERGDPASNRPGLPLPRDRLWDEPIGRSHQLMSRDYAPRPMGAMDPPPQQGRPIMRDAFDRPIFSPESDRFDSGPSARRGPELSRDPFPDRPPFVDARPGRPHYPPY